MLQISAELKDKIAWDCADFFIKNRRDMLESDFILILKKHGLDYPVK